MPLAQERREDRPQLGADVRGAVLAPTDALTPVDEDGPLREVEVGVVQPKQLPFPKPGVDEGREDRDRAGALVGRRPGVVLGSEQDAFQLLGAPGLWIHVGHHWRLHPPERVHDSIAALEVVEERAQTAPKGVHSHAGKPRPAAVPRNPLVDREEAIAEGVSGALGRGEELLEVVVSPPVTPEGVGALSFDVQAVVQERGESTVERGDGPSRRIGCERRQDAIDGPSGVRGDDRPRACCLSWGNRNRGESSQRGANHGSGGGGNGVPSPSVRPRPDDWSADATRTVMETRRTRVGPSDFWLPAAALAGMTRLELATFRVTGGPVGVECRFVACSSRFRRYLGSSRPSASLRNGRERTEVRRNWTSKWNTTPQRAASSQPLPVRLL